MSDDTVELPSPEEHARQSLTPTDTPLPSDAEKGFARSRRTFLFQLAVGLNAVVGAVLAVPLLGYVLAPLFRKDQSYNAWVPIAKVNDMPVGATRLLDFLNPTRTPTDGETAKIPVWARRISADRYEVFAINCAHLGCPVRWFEQSQLFLCPCHGGAYYSTGEVAAGPPPRGLYKYDVRLDGGTVLIHAGELPTLRNTACSGAGDRRLIQLEPHGSESASGYNLLPGRKDEGSDV